MDIMETRLLKRVSVAMAICLLGCGHATTSKTGINSVTQHDPPYFKILERGHDLERSKDYVGAIKEYKEALRLCDGVDPDLRRRAKIAVHNRSAACYRYLGDSRAALREFSASVDLGDDRYAPKAIQKLRGSGALHR